MLTLGIVSLFNFSHFRGVVIISYWALFCVICHSYVSFDKNDCSIKRNRLFVLLKICTLDISLLSDRYLYFFPVLNLLFNFLEIVVPLQLSSFSPHYSPLPYPLPSPTFNPPPDLFVFVHGSFIHVP